MSTERLKTRGLEGLAGTYRSSNAVAGEVSKSVYLPWLPRLTRRGKRLLHDQPYPILKEGGMSCFEDNSLMVSQSGGDHRPLFLLLC